MTQSLRSVVYNLKLITEQEKQIKKEKDELRAQLFDYAVQDYDGKEYLLPTTTITVPTSFWVSTGLTIQGFLDRSFPTWDLISCDTDDARCLATFVLRKKPLYMPFKYENDEVKLSKTAVEPTPDIDLETLKAETPTLFEKITSQRVIEELDGEKLQSALAEDPEVHSVLMRHTVYSREPQQRVGIKDAS